MLGKEAALKIYRKKLAKLLSQRYGASPTYTEGQVRTTIEEEQINTRYIKYAFLMYCEQEVLASNGETEDSIAQMQQE